MSEKRTSDGLIYLASPYSHDDTQIRDGRFREVCKWAARFMRAGKLIFSPIAHTHPIAMAGELPTGWAFWQKYDHAQLDAASEMWVLMLDGWDKSKGVQGEIEYMKVKGKPIRYIDPICEPTDDRFPSPEFFRDTLTATPTPPQPGEPGGELPWVEAEGEFRRWLFSEGPVDGDDCRELAAKASDFYSKAWLKAGDGEVEEVRRENAELRNECANKALEIIRLKVKADDWDGMKGGWESMGDMLAERTKEANDLAQQLTTSQATIAERDAEIAQLRFRLLSAAGDDLCRLSQEEIKAYTSGAVQIPPKEEFIPSCERFHAQIAAGPGVLTNCLTLAQLIAENASLEKRLAEAEAFLKLFRSYVDARENHPMVAGEMYRELLKAAGLIKDTQPTEAKHELP